ncbi:MAG: DUF3488 domain-containing protein [Acidimicrobiia bacterium]|nr:DUF3488 domain-containing protein [Acidimicrobiia bacterium]
MSPHRTPWAPPAPICPARGTCSRRWWHPLPPSRASSSPPASPSGWRPISPTGAAFRLWSSFEALVPTGTLFVFASLLGGDDDRVLAAAVWFSAAVAFVLTHRIVRQQASAGWLGSREDDGTGSLVQRGAALGACSLVVALVVGPLLPGAEEPAVLHWRDVGGEGSGGARVTLSPMVDIRARLDEQSQVEVFTVRSDAPSYWRLTSLDTFDGTIWKSRGDYDDADGTLPGNVPDEVPQEESVQRYDIEALNALWLPAAYEPQRPSTRRAPTWRSRTGRPRSSSATSVGPPTA